MHFSNQLTKIMADKKISQTELSELTGIGKASISNYCSGKYEPKREVVKKLSNVLGVRESFLFGSEIVPENNKELGSMPFIFSTKKITVRTAAKVMHISESIFLERIRNGLYDFVDAYKAKSEWSYYISPKKFYEYTGWRYDS